MQPTEDRNEAAARFNDDEEELVSIFISQSSIAAFIRLGKGD